MLLSIFTPLMKALFSWAYDILVKGPLYLVKGLGDGVGFLSGQKIINIVFGTHGHSFDIPPELTMFILIGGALMTILACTTIMVAIMHHETKSIMTGMFQRLLILIFLIALMPIFFWLANFVVVSIVNIIFPQFNQGQAIADSIGVIGWTDGGNHQGWHFQNNPTYKHYNLFLGGIGSIFSMVIFLLLAISLIQRVFELFLLYIISPVVLSTAISNSRWQKVNLWKDLAISRFISTIGVVISINLFTSLEPKMLIVANEITSNTIGRDVLQLAFIIAGVFAIIEAQNIFAQLVGRAVGINDGVRMLTRLQSLNTAVKIGAFGLGGVGKGVLFGRNIGKSVGNNKMSGTASKRNGLIPMSFRATKGFARGGLKTAGYLKKSAENIKQHGFKLTAKELSTKPIRSAKKGIKDILNKKIADPSKTNFSIGKSKNNISEYVNQNLEKKEVKDFMKKVKNK